jgi:hypothetical protein
MVQAAGLDGLLFDAPPLSQDGFTATIASKVLHNRNSETHAHAFV